METIMKDTNEMGERKEKEERESVFEREKEGERLTSRI